MKKSKEEKMTIRISEFIGRPFSPWKENHSFTAKFTTYKACKAYIKKRPHLKGYVPGVGFEKGCGRYLTNYNDLMKVLEFVMTYRSSGEGNELMTIEDMGIKSPGIFYTKFKNMKGWTGSTLEESIFRAIHAVASLQVNGTYKINTEDKTVEVFSNEYGSQTIKI